MAYIGRRKLGAHRGARRLWLEGSRLNSAGFTRGLAFRATPRPDGSMDIQLDADGDRHVAGTEARPIIDVLTHAFPETVTYVTVTIETGRILACPE
jgi:hypothetical protein